MSGGPQTKALNPRRRPKRKLFIVFSAVAGISVILGSMKLLMVTHMQEQDESLHWMTSIDTVASTGTGIIQHREVRWFDHKHLYGNDYFSATWLLTLETFLKTNLENLGTVESAVNRVYNKNRPIVRMAADWMDFSVEHMSKWYKHLDASNEKNNNVGIDRINNAFLDYISSSSMEQTPSPNLLHPTIAIIAFASSVKRDGDVTLQRSTNVTITSLGATLASLSRVGFGRMLVVGLQDDDESLVQEAFKLQQNNPDLEYAYVQVRNETWYKTKHIKFNVPVAGIVGLQHAFKGDLSEDETKLWLGNDKDYWKYIYLTEPDTILQTRRGSLKAIHDALENGKVLIPHRLQPIPHYTDVNGTSSPSYIKKLGKFAEKPVIDLSREDDACCDEATHPKNEFPKCGRGRGRGRLWCLCGFRKQHQHHNETEYNEFHKRLLPYNFFRIQGGTGIVSLAATNHGRLCRPEKRPGFVCEAPNRTEFLY